jgi:hypothetical protein
MRAPGRLDLKAPIDNLDRHRELYRSPIGVGPHRFCCGRRRSSGETGRSCSPAVCIARARCAGDGDRHQRDEPAPRARPSAKVQLAEPRSASARDRASRGARPDIRPDRLHWRAPPSCRPGCQPSGAAQCPCTQRRDALDGLCNIWACGYLHDAGVLPSARDWRHTA